HRRRVPARRRGRGDLCEVPGDAESLRNRRGGPHPPGGGAMIPVRQTWPAEFAERYRRAGYWRGETFGAFLRERAAAHPDHPAVVSGETRWSYRDLDARADACAAGFASLGLRPGDRVIVQLPNVPEFLSVVFGLFRAGLLPVFALPAH